MDCPCFFMLCTDRTEQECLDRMLLGDRPDQFESMRSIQTGHAGFLVNMSRDELLGVFRAEGSAGMNIQLGVWAGKFPAQVKVQLVGELQRVSGAAGQLGGIVELKVLGAGPNVYLVPAERTHGPEVTAKVLPLFGERSRRERSK